MKIVEAIRAEAVARRERAGGPVAPTSRRVDSAEPAAVPIGARAERYEARELALGEKPFVADLRAPGMLHGALRFADHPRAMVRRIDVSRALDVPGVVAVLTAADVPGRRYQGLIVDDWPLFVAEGETTPLRGRRDRRRRGGVERQPPGGRPRWSTSSTR